MEKEYLEQVLRISRILAEKQSIDESLNYAMEAAMELVDARKGHLILLQEDGTFDFYVIHGEPDEVSQSVLKRTINDRAPIWVPDALQDEEFSGADSIQTHLLRSIVCVPLISGDKLLGAIYVENRKTPDVFTLRDLGLLEYFANQAAVLIDNALLTDNLQVAHTALIHAREDERRRLRRDLHDGLGPSLAALRLQLQAANNLVAVDVESSHALLEDSKTEIQNILSNVRDIVDHLRPAVLEELGLTSTIREYITTIELHENIAFHFEAPTTTITLSAALEVALYRIIQEAVTNIIRHANASRCDIQLRVEDAIYLNIHDNGKGLDDGTQYGVGLLSIRERVEELEGVFDVQNANGLQLQITLPI